MDWTDEEKAKIWEAARASLPKKEGQSDEIEECDLTFEEFKRLITDEGGFNLPSRVKDSAAVIAKNNPKTAPPEGMYLADDGRLRREVSNAGYSSGGSKPGADSATAATVAAAAERSGHNGAAHALDGESAQQAAAGSTSAGGAQEPSARPVSHDPFVDAPESAAAHDEARERSAAHSAAHSGANERLSRRVRESLGGAPEGRASFHSSAPGSEDSTTGAPVRCQCADSMSSCWLARRAGQLPVVRSAVVQDN